ncbi:hypothetical protein, partial [Mycobacteroides abscessus]
QTFDIQIILGKVRPFLRRLAEAHPQVLIIARRAIREWDVVSARCADLYSEDSRDGRQIDLTSTGARGCGVRESDRTSTA